ncbi:CREA protein [Aureimonas sp. Leaf454]|uniref:CreA family protein n=1 Tax=Aureimonas sp. Leaf454 TaxID=1736381 RepID=UPI0006FDFA36|nr:CreA family protein [Aureimonas sp. Leaf454]KQT44637.1 CREA protein [Aureimonas sp. Leaf454]
MLPAVIAALFVGLPALADEVGDIGTDWLGNEIKIEAVADPKIRGVTCHVSYFDRGVVDRLSQGNWFEDPSNSSIACRQTGPIVIGDIDLDEDGEEIFSTRRSLVFKALQVNRVYDKANDTLIYLAFAREIAEGSAKMAISTIPLFSAAPTWEKGRPQ